MRQRTMTLLALATLALAGCQSAKEKAAHLQSDYDKIDSQYKAECDDPFTSTDPQQAPKVLRGETMSAADKAASERVLINMDTTVHPELINTRFAYVSVSRASLDAHIYTNDAARLSERLSADVTKTSAINLEQSRSETKTQEPAERKEAVMTNSREQSQEEQRRQFQVESNVSQPDKVAEQIDHRHYAPIQTALRDEAAGYDWKRETGDIQSYQHTNHHGWLHIDPHGSFYDRQAQPISRETALENVGHISPALDNSQTRSVSSSNDQGVSL